MFPQKNTNYIKNLVEVNKLIAEDILSNPSFNVEELEEIRDKMSSLIEQLEFWAEQDNSNRFMYELKEFLNWIIDNYS